jgi:hypothetical protein
MERGSGVFATAPYRVVEPLDGGLGCLPLITVSKLVLLVLL